MTEINNKLEEINKAKSNFDAIVNDQLIPIWQRQINLRNSAAERLNSAVLTTKNGKPSVVVSIIPYGNREDFKKFVTEFRADGRKISDSDWYEFLDSVFNSAINNEASPSSMLADWINDLRKGSIPNDCSLRESEKKIKTLTDWFGENEIYQLRTYRVPDSVKIELFRAEDGSLVGALEDHVLSAGQKSTAILSLLLAQGDEPMIIDQPEDDLDNEFIYGQLVPLLRNKKEDRQIIVVSHNANIPVNGDAELIIPLEVQNGRGTTKKVNSNSAVGALDNLETCEAVAQIMEGGQEAFRKRKEKYGF